MTGRAPVLESVVNLSILKLYLLETYLFDRPRNATHLTDFPLAGAAQVIAPLTLYQSNNCAAKLA